MEKVSIVIPVFNHLKMTIDCLNDVIRTSGVEIEIIVVDDGSHEPIKKAIPRVFPQVKLLINEVNSGFAKTVNKGIAAATHDNVLLLNNDIRINNPSWLKLLLQEMKDSNLDMTAPAGGRMNSKWEYIPGEANKKGQDFSYLVGWCLLVKRKVFDKIGLMPEDFGKGFFEDVLFSYRAKRANFKLGITENTGVEHAYHATFKDAGYNINKKYMEKRAIFLDVVGKER